MMKFVLKGHFKFGDFCVLVTFRLVDIHIVVTFVFWWHLHFPNNGFYANIFTSPTYALGLQFHNGHICVFCEIFILALFAVWHHWMFYDLWVRDYLRFGKICVFATFVFWCYFPFGNRCVLKTFGFDNIWLLVTYAFWQNLRFAKSFVLSNFALWQH